MRSAPWENKITLQTFHHLAKVEPRLYVPRIAPEKLLYIAAAEDPLTGTLDEHKAVVATARPGASFAVVRPNHLGTYFGAAFEETMAVQIRFLEEEF